MPRYPRMTSTAPWNVSSDWGSNLTGDTPTGDTGASDRQNLWAGQQSRELPYPGMAETFWDQQADRVRAGYDTPRANAVHAYDQIDKSVASREKTADERFDRNTRKLSKRQLNMAYDTYKQSAVQGQGTRRRTLDRLKDAQGLERAEVWGEHMAEERALDLERRLAGETKTHALNRIAADMATDVDFLEDQETFDKYLWSKTRGGTIPGGIGIGGAWGAGLRGASWNTGGGWW